MICLKCGEVNSDTFRFCGMCGNLLDVPPQARRPTGTPTAGVPKTANSGEPIHPMVVESSPRPATATAANPLNSSLPSFGSPSSPQPSTDLLREKSFSGLDSFFEPEQPKGGRRVFLLLLLLVALGIAGWWTYTNYLGVTQSGKSTTSTAANAESPVAEPPANRSVKDPTPPDAPSSQATPSPSAVVPEGPSENAKAGSDASAKPAEAEKTTVPQLTTPATPSPKPAPSKVIAGDKSASRPESVVTAPKPAKLTTPTDTGDAEFRRGEASLYGRGAPENCSEAVKNLKAASAKSNAKARSAFGTMYATGHCVPRDLPTSYLWFAMALQVDPNNQILEKDLSAIWNQMTPPERQLAMRMKQ